VNNSSTPSLPAAQRDALEARFALRVRTRLDEGAQALPHDIGERLRVAGAQAVEAARAARASKLVEATVSAPIVVTQGELRLAGGHAVAGVSAPMPPQLWREAAAARAAQHGHLPKEAPLGWGWRLALLMPVLALLVGFWGIQRYQHLEHVEATTAVDLQLLTDDLPPDAYADPGFEAYLSMDTDPDVAQWVDAAPDADGDLSTTETAPAVSGQ